MDKRLTNYDVDQQKKPSNQKNRHVIQVPGDVYFDDWSEESRPRSRLKTLNLNVQNNMRRRDHFSSQRLDRIKQAKSI